MLEKIKDINEHNSILIHHRRLQWSSYYDASETVCQAFKRIYFLLDLVLIAHFISRLYINSVISPVTNEIHLKGYA